VSRGSEKRKAEAYARMTDLGREIMAIMERLDKDPRWTRPRHQPCYPMHLRVKTPPVLRPKIVPITALPPPSEEPTERIVRLMELAERKRA